MFVRWATDVHALFTAYRRGNTRVYIGGWGGESVVKPPTGKSISVSVRVVRASGRGEAKLCGRARGDSIVKLGRL